MQFIDYISNVDNIYEKALCPDECEFKDNIKVPIVGVYPPSSDKFLGVIISRDPTTRFKDPYLKARVTPERWHDELMEADAPPQWIINKIRFFDGKYVDDVRFLEKMMADNIYWTHLHKCCTDKLEKELDAKKFKRVNAKLCMKTWLVKEFSDVVDYKVRFIICLGKDVENLIKPIEGSLTSHNIRVFYLPHPSDANNGTWYSKEAKVRDNITKNIDGLLLLCKSLSN